jgi:hypothetical protein
MEIMIPYLVIVAFPYIFIFIIVIFFNSIQVKNNNDLNNLKIKEIKKYRKDKLPEIKKELQKILYENDPILTEAFEESFKDYIYIDIPQATTGAAASTSSANCSGSANGANAAGANAAKASINIDIVAIIFIYKHNLKVLQKSGDQLKQYQRKYINYIDEYFDLLNRTSGSGSGEDNYTKFYLFGLIEYKDGDNEDFSGRIREYRDIIKAADGGEDGGGLEKLLIKQITGNLSAYFITLISFYTIFAVAAIVLLLKYNDTVKMPFIYTLIMIGKVVSLQSFLIIITVLLVLIGLFALLFIVVFPQIYNLTYALSARMF